jgi:hypothetical protein
VEMVKPPSADGKAAPGSPQSRMQQRRQATKPQVQKAVVSKLIDKIRSI